MAGEGLKVVGGFLFSIIMYEKEGGTIDWIFNYVNNNVPREMILTPIKAFIKEQENKYYNEDYKNRLSK